MKLKEQIKVIHEERLFKVGKFKISKHPAIPKTHQVSVIWIERKGGEGMSIDLDKLWKEKF